MPLMTRLLAMAQRARRPDAPDAGIDARWIETMRDAMVLQVNPESSHHPCNNRTMLEQNCWNSAGVGEPLFAPFLQRFQTLNQTRLARYRPMFESEAAFQAIGRLLVRDLSRACARTIAFEVKRVSLAGTLLGDTPEARFQDYVGRVLCSPDGLLTLLETYPVLACFIGTITDQMDDTARECLDRLQRDSADISPCFSDKQSAGLLAEFIGGLSDPHEGGRSVFRLRFASGLELFYKPRSPGTDQAFDAVVAHFNANRKDEDVKLREVKRLDRSDYSWFEAVGHAPCTDAAALTRFHQRQGALSALLWFCGASDFHHENLLADGEHPIAIDLECLATPLTTDAVPATELTSRPAWAQPIHSTVLGTGLAPYWVNGGSGGPLFAASGLGGIGDRQFTGLRPVWQGVGTDQLRLTQAPQAMGSVSCRPVMCGQPVALGGHLPEVIEGFRSGYSTLMQQFGELSGPLPDLFQVVLNPVVVRVVLRDTRMYHDLLDWLTSPDLLISGSAQATAMQNLADMPSTMAQLPPGLVEAEMTALWQRDIPRFTAMADSRDLRACSGRTFRNALNESGTQVLQARWPLTGLPDLTWQSALLTAAFAVVDEPPPKQTRRGDADGEFNERLLAHALAIGNAMERQAVRGPWGATWLLLAPTHGNAVTQHAAGLDLYAGTPGIALVLSTLWQHSGEDRFATLAREALDYAHHLLAVQNAQGSSMRCSAYEGWVSVAWADMACGVLLHDAALMDRAQALALATPLAVFESETSIDFVSGAAGAISALLAIHQRRPSEGLLTRCHALAQVIASSQLDCGSNLGGWKPPQLPHPVLGLGHGAAGICHALAALYKVTGEVSLLRDLKQGLAFESRHFNPNAKDWPDLRSTEQEGEPSYMVGWCAGACGAGMVRLRLTALLKTQAPANLREDIEAAIDATLAALKSDEGGDHLCCGEAGRIMFLMEAAGQARRPELEAAARDAAQAMLNRFEFSGTLELQAFSERLTVPSLMGGTGGIALALLWASGKPGAANPLTLQIT